MTDLAIGGMTGPRRAVQRARIGVTAIFFMNGAVFANLVPRIPEVRTTLGASEATLGFALLAMALGGLLSMSTAGRLCDRVGPHRPLLVAVIAFPVAFALLGLAGSLPLFAAGLFLYGAAAGLLDVSMNLVGAGVERAARRAIFASFHGAFSLGGMIGAGIGALAAEAGVPLMLHLAFVGALGLAGGLAAFAALGGGEGEAPPAPAAERSGRLSVSALAVLGLVAFAALTAEGVVTDWSAILLVDYRGAGAGEAGLAFVAFSAAMTVGRLTGDRVIAALGRRLVVGAGGLLAAIGLGLAVSVSHPLVAAAGFAVTGLGLSCMFPALLAAAVAAMPHRSGTAMSAVATLGYFGFLVGPPLIGLGAEAFGLPLAIAAVVALLAAAAAGSRLMPAPAR